MEGDQYLAHHSYIDGHPRLKAFISQNSSPIPALYTVWAELMKSLLSMFAQLVGSSAP
jgi:hypothetical protein